MKKILNYILLTAVLGTFLPYSALAQTTDVGVNITGSVSIDVVTTISANITLDLTTGETTPTYMGIQNNSEVPVSAKITDISTTSEGAPSTFVGHYDKNWGNLSKEETSTYANFNILGSGQNVTAQDILPNTEMDLGTLAGRQNGMGADIGEFVHYNGDIYNFYEIRANFGRNWSEGDKNFTYQITTVYSVADSYIDPILSYTYPSDLSNLVSLDVIICENLEDEGLNESNKDYMLLDYGINDDNKTFLDKSVRIYVNNESANQETVTYGTETFEYVGLGADIGKETTNYGVPYSFSALESSPEGTANYLNIRVIINDQTYTFVEKVVAYSK